MAPYAAMRCADEACICVDADILYSCMSVCLCMCVYTYIHICMLCVVFLHMQFLRMYTYTCKCLRVHIHMYIRLQLDHMLYLTGLDGIRAGCILAAWFEFILIHRFIRCVVVVAIPAFGEQILRLRELCSTAS